MRRRKRHTSKSRTFRTKSGAVYILTKVKGPSKRKRHAKKRHSRRRR
jgi:hypothetical protein